MQRQIANMTELAPGFSMTDKRLNEGVEATIEHTHRQNLASVILRPVRQSTGLSKGEETRVSLIYWTSYLSFQLLSWIVACMEIDFYDRASQVVTQKRIGFRSVLVGSPFPMPTLSSICHLP